MPALPLRLTAAALLLCCTVAADATKHAAQAAAGGDTEPATPATAMQAIASGNSKNPPAYPAPAPAAAAASGREQATADAQPPATTAAAENPYAETTSDTPNAEPEATRWRDAKQLVLVTTPDWNADHGELRTFLRQDGRWHAQTRAIKVSIGRAGSAWGLGLHDTHAGPRKREGDGRSPAGVFRLGTAFGYADTLRTALPYAAMQATHYCIDVTSSPLYNRIVDTREVGAAAVQGSTEPMRRDIHVDGDVRYKAGFVIEHNSAGLSGGGSCIFAHLWRKPGEATSGCTAMDEAAMQQLLRWLDPKQMPVFVLLPQAEYAKLAADWQLPPVAG